MLGNPSAEELMMIIAATGLAQNFSAVRALTTSGIQKGHMKMHLTNILKTYNATETQMKSAQVYFADKTISFTAVREYLNSLNEKAVASSCCATRHVHLSLELCIHYTTECLRGPGIDEREIVLGSRCVT